MEKGTAARQAAAVECGFNGSFLRRCRRRWEGFRIEIEGNDTYAVRSPGSERRRTVRLSRCGWSCTCPRALYRKFHCRHIKAAKCVFLLPEPGRKEPVVLDPVPEDTCPRCGTADAAKAGVRKNRNYRNQIYKCRRCKRRFSANLGFEKLSAPPDVVSQAIRDYFGGKSTGEIADDLRDKLACPPTQQTVNNWLRSFSAMAGRFCSGLDPCLGEVEDRRDARRGVRQPRVPARGDGGKKARIVRAGAGQARAVWRAPAQARRLYPATGRGARSTEPEGARSGRCRRKTPDRWNRTPPPSGPSSRRFGRTLGTKAILRNDAGGQACLTHMQFCDCTVQRTKFWHS